VAGLRLLLTALVTLSLSASLAQGSDGVGVPAAAGDVPVASLEPERTAAEWRRLVSTHALRSQQQPGDCRPLRAVFYAATDWLRLATKLAAASSPCADYYFSIPAIVGNRTQLRRNAAPRIRALGANFHALAEIHFTAWNRWVAETGNSWHAAGVTARQRMTAAGYDVARGDSWALNELSTAVRRGEGNARTNIREFLRGLYEGDGQRPTKGAVLVVGFGQRTGDLSLYQNTLQSWLTDSAFWTDMATYVSDWSQEVYGDVRAHAVPASPREVRREYLNDYLQHKLVLAGAGPAEIEPARAFLREAYSPLANAAWERDSGYGWTMVPVELMAAYTSSQVEAMRFFSATTGQARDHWGFAWAPRNATAMTAGDFAERTGRLLDRLAAAIRDSAASDLESPGSGACGPPGQDLCASDLAEARFNDGWRSFRAWTQPLLQFTTAPQTVVAGTPSAAIGLALVTSTGAPITVPQAIAVTVRSSSPSGTFSLSPAGPWTSTLALSVSSTSPVAFYYLDTRAGAHTLTASGAGATSGTQIVTVTAGPVAALELRPTVSEIRARGSRRFVAAAADANGNAAAATVTWRVSPPALGTFARAPGGAVTFTAGRLIRTGTVTATAGALAASASVTVTTGRLRLASMNVAASRRGARVVVDAVDGARRPVSGAALTLVARRDGRRVLTGRAVTGTGGKALFRMRGVRGCVRLAVTRVRAVGFTWDGRSPERRFCRR
jgi:hypothetical protein